MNTDSVAPATKALTLFLVLYAFSSGASALTGVEAISNGIRRSAVRSRGTPR